MDDELDNNDYGAVLEKLDFEVDDVDDPTSYTCYHDNVYVPPF
jgi:hypothetical protein